MKTAATVDLPEIEWDPKWGFMSDDLDEREEIYEARGTGKDGKEYIGIATFSCDELINITDIYEQ